MKEGGYLELKVSLLTRHDEKSKDLSEIVVSMDFINCLNKLGELIKQDQREGSFAFVLRHPNIDELLLLNPIVKGSNFFVRLRNMDLSIQGSLKDNSLRKIPLVIAPNMNFKWIRIYNPAFRYFDLEVLKRYGEIFLGFIEWKFYDFHIETSNKHRPNSICVLLEASVETPIEYSIQEDVVEAIEGDVLTSSLLGMVLAFETCHGPGGFPIGCCGFCKSPSHKLSGCEQFYKVSPCTNCGVCGHIHLHCRKQKYVSKEKDQNENKSNTRAHSSGIESGQSESKMDQTSQSELPYQIGNEIPAEISQPVQSSFEEPIQVLEEPITQTSLSEEPTTQTTLSEEPTTQTPSDELNSTQYSLTEPHHNLSTGKQVQTTMDNFLSLPQRRSKRAKRIEKANKHPVIESKVPEQEEGSNNLADINTMEIDSQNSEYDDDDDVNSNKKRILNGEGKAKSPIKKKAITSEENN